MPVKILLVQLARHNSRMAMLSNYETMQEYTADELRDLLLAQLPTQLDKREGSIVWDIATPIANALAEVYSTMYDLYLDGSPETATEEMLDRWASIYGVERKTDSAQTLIVTMDDVSEDYEGATLLDSGSNTYYTLGEQNEDGTYIAQCDVTGERPVPDIAACSVIDPVGTILSLELETQGSDLELDDQLRIRVQVARQAMSVLVNSFALITKVMTAQPMCQFVRLLFADPILYITGLNPAGMQVSLEPENIQVLKDAIQPYVSQDREVAYALGTQHPITVTIGGIAAGVYKPAESDILAALNKWWTRELCPAWGALTSDGQPTKYITIDNADIQNVISTVPNMPSTYTITVTYDGAAGTSMSLPNDWGTNPQNIGDWFYFTSVEYGV